MTALVDGHFDMKRGDDLYGKVFHAVGVDVEAGAPEDVGERLSRTTVAAELAAALDDWAEVRRNLRGPADTSWRFLLRVARAADRDEGRNRVRDALAKREKEALVRVAASDDATRLLPRTLNVLGLALQEAGAAKQAEALLRAARRRAPDDFWANEDLGYFLEHSPTPQLAEAARLYAAAVALRPSSPGAHLNLAHALHGKGELDAAIAEYQEAIRINKDYAHAHNNLGTALYDKKDLAGAIAEYKKAIELDPKLAEFHFNLGDTLLHQNDLKGAIAECEKAIALHPKHAKAHVCTGNALRQQNKLDAAIEEYKKAIDCNPKYAIAHYSLGLALHDKRELKRAIDAYKDAIAIDPNFAPAYNNLGNALADTQHLDEAIIAYNKAIENDSKNAIFHYNLGNTLKAKGQLKGAITAYKKAIEINKDYAEAECNLGSVLMEKGEFVEALDHYHRGREIGLKIPGWPYQDASASWVKNCQRLVDLDRKLPAIIASKEQAAKADLLNLAFICSTPARHLYAAAARFYSAAFDAQPQLAGAQPSLHRYNAACAAAQAGCGQGKDASPLSEEKSADLRRQALEWLRADLAAWRAVLQEQPAKALPVVAKQMAHWLEDTDLAGVRGPEAPAQLPDEERQAWQKLWAEVEQLCKKAGGDVPRPKK
jgi:tetratricopeptide (TPR) repeat protein